MLIYFIYVYEDIIMAMNVNNQNLNAKNIFAALDAKDGKQDGKVQKSVWNAFAEISGGNKISNYIEEKNGVNAIGKYLANANDTVKTNIMSYLGGLVKPEAETKAPKTTNTTPVNKTTETSVVSKKVENSNKTQSAENVSLEGTEYKKEYDMIKTLVDFYGYKVSEEDCIKFAKEVYTQCERSHVSPEAVISIICIESNFSRKPADRGSKGVMQITGITIDDMLKHKDTYEKLDYRLYKEVMYDANGRKRSKSEILKKCYEEPEFCIKAGILCYKRKEVKAICQETGYDVKDVAQAPQYFKNQLTEAQRKHIQEQTFYYYNANNHKGGASYVNRLKKHGIDVPANVEVREGYRAEATRNYEMLGGKYDKVPQPKISIYDNEAVELVF